MQNYYAKLNFLVCLQSSYSYFFFVLVRYFMMFWLFSELLLSYIIHVIFVFTRNNNLVGSTKTAFEFSKRFVQQLDDIAFSLAKVRILRNIVKLFLVAFLFVQYLKFFSAHITLLQDGCIRQDPAACMYGKVLPGRV